ncbi:MAG: flagellar basal-body MS-ring/collar protein FliF [Thermodesulfobacteriaceae bacterium]|nr:flagellar basal-body MS-ring/collar protein FliF [Thermodesulfobacteriaceae bacterium]MDW8135893.1 flagellar basal-body MS-ring/collar protein FliF [Thermodesulfobacterium sp.]
MKLPDFRLLFTQLREFWGKLTTKQKFFILGGSLGLTALLILGVWLATRPTWGLLYRGLDERTTGNIVEYLKQQKVPYKVEADGSIYVHQERVPELRMEIASKGLIGGPGPGFELFDKEKIGLTDFQEKVTYQRALEGELARTIMGIEGVKSVRVHLAMPKESIFIEEEKPPKASVLIEMKPGFYLNPNQVKGILNLVSGAVPNLKPENIKIVDATTGKSLDLALEEEEVNKIQKQLSYKRKLEEYYKSKVEELLSGALGQGRAIAQVSVEVSFDKENITEETYDPEGSVVVSEDLEEEKRQTTLPQEGGVAGVKGALAEKFEATPTNQTQGEIITKKRAVRNYELSKKLRTLEILPGSIKKISVGVVVDKEVLTENDTAKITWVENLVKGAIGYNPDRGDEVKVEAKTFTKPPVKKPGIMDYLVQLYKPLLVLIIILLVFIFIVRPLMKTLLVKPLPPPKEELPPEVKPVVEERVEEVPLPHEVALGIIQSQPERAAILVKKWLLEETLEERKKALSEAS